MEVQTNPNVDIPNSESGRVLGKGVRSKRKPPDLQARRHQTPQRDHHLLLTATTATPSGIRCNCNRDHLPRTFLKFSSAITSQNNYIIIQRVARNVNICFFDGHRKIRVLAEGELQSVCRNPHNLEAKPGPPACWLISIHSVNTPWVPIVCQVLAWPLEVGRQKRL